MTTMPSPIFQNERRQKGSALVIVLAFLVILLGLIVAFFSLSGTNRSTSQSSANQTSVDLFARGALDTIIGDLQQEIRDTGRSKEYTAPNSARTLYLPALLAFAVPEVVVPNLIGTDLVDGGTGDGMENLLKVSTSTSGFYTTGAAAPSSRAAAISSVTPTSKGRSISLKRWNKALLMKGTGPDDPTPPAAFVPPDWILVARDGSNPKTFDSGKWSRDQAKQQTIIGRYAYAIYNEGGLLDANVAGYPESVAAGSSSTSTDITTGGLAIKNPLRLKAGAAYADLTQLAQTGEVALTQNEVDTLVDWRNGATLENDAPEKFFKLALNNETGFLNTNYMDAGAGGDTDRMFVNRQQLINFFKDELPGREEILQYLGTFSRSLNQPAFYRMQGQDSSVTANYDGNVKTVAPLPNVTTTEWNSNSGVGNSGAGFDAIINPIIPSISASSGTRFDGSEMKADEPLVKKRFPLDRLVWVTYKGPSASLSGDPLIGELKKQGITQDYLDRGTAENIEKAFGLKWNGTGLSGYWTYDVHGAAAGEGPSAINALEDVAPLGRDPDFFELLKASINVGAIGRTSSGAHQHNAPFTPSGGGYASAADLRPMQENIRASTLINNHIIQIGANIIDQAQPDNYPTHIVLEDSGVKRSFWGVVDLPYFSGWAFKSVVFRLPNPMPPPIPPGSLPDYKVPDETPAVTLMDSGDAALLMMPFVWNPHREPTTTSPYPSALSPQKLRICVSTSTIAQGGAAGSPAIDWIVTASEKPVAGQNHLATPPTTPPTTPPINVNWRLGVTYDDDTGSLIFDQNHKNVLTFNNFGNLYREPTILFRPGIPSSPAASGLALGPGAISQFTADGYGANGVMEGGTGTKTFVGFYLGHYPIRWNKPVGGVAATHTVNFLTMNETGVPSRGFTFSLEFDDGSGQWVPYKQYIEGYDKLENYNTCTYKIVPSSPYYVEKPLLELMERDISHWVIDPRTQRFGWSSIQQYQFLPAGNTNSNKAQLQTVRPGLELGYDDKNPTANPSERGGLSKDNFWDYRPGGQYLLDADDVWRRPMGGYVSPITLPVASGPDTDGLPLQTVSGANEKFNRPAILHRPFRSVAELGYVFTDTPWRNINFSAPESGFTGLLDVFCIGEDPRAEPLVAGKVDLNTRQKPVLRALLKFAYRDEWDAVPALSNAEKFADALVARTNSIDPVKGPLTNISDLVGRYAAKATNDSPAGAEPYDGFGADLGQSGGSKNDLVQRLREAAVRALSASGQAGTWNLLIDLVAQTGKYPASASGPNEFNVEAERRVWLHVAIDRLTGKVIDQQVEVVSE